MWFPNIARSVSKTDFRVQMCCRDLPAMWEQIREGDKTNFFFDCCTFFSCTAVKPVNLVKGCFQNSDKKQDGGVGQVLILLCASSSYFIIVLKGGGGCLSLFSANSDRNPKISISVLQKLNSCCLFTGPASPLSSQLKHGSGYSEGK